MVRLAAGLEYKGTHYTGWQKQHDQPSVAGEVERTLSRVANHPINIVTAGRTDKGVHAIQQVIHFDSDSIRTDDNWVHGTNSFLPPDIRLHWVRQVSNDFHARFSATSRRYTYLIYNHRTQPALLHEYCNWQYLPLDHTMMDHAAQYLTGYHDFNNFRSTDCQSHSSYRQVHFARCSRQGNWIRLDIQANAFLHKMVRMIVAELIDIGKGKHPPDRMQQLTDASERRHKPVAKASGLFLTWIGYETHWQLPMIPAEQVWLYTL